MSEKKFSWGNVYLLLCLNSNMEGEVPFALLVVSNQMVGDLARPAVHLYPKTSATHLFLKFLSVLSGILHVIKKN